MYDPRNVVSFGFPLDDFTFTYNLAAGTVLADVGKALSIDPTGASKMKLAGDGDTIRGRLTTFEDRTQQGAGLKGAVQRRFKEKLPAAAAHGIVPGDSVVGAGGGLVKKAAGANNTLVVEAGADFVVVELL
ncbi:hypothetical protein [Sphingomonas jaspsi]|uniref:hypothetical protein n=1 Tax=Sphingomonas jaspsi TaxID=392409 RepID=UPI0004B62163|nr:hypothetical protein [Sphingomonas jaspsi]